MKCSFPLCLLIQVFTALTVCFGSLSCQKKKNSINFDKVPNTIGWNAVLKHDRDFPYFIFIYLFLQMDVLFLKIVLSHPSSETTSEEASVNSRGIDWRACGTDAFLTSSVIFFAWCFPSFALYFFKDRLHTMSRCAKFLTNSSLGIYLLVQNYYFILVKLCYLWHFLMTQLNKLDQKNNTNTWIKLKIYSPWSLFLLAQNSTGIHIYILNIANVAETHEEDSSLLFVRIKNQPTNQKRDIYRYSILDIYEALAAY